MNKGSVVVTYEAKITIRKETADTPDPTLLTNSDVEQIIEAAIREEYLEEHPSYSVNAIVNKT